MIRRVLTRDMCARMISSFYGYKGTNYYGFLKREGIFPDGVRREWGQDTVKRFQLAIILSKIIIEKGLEVYARDVRPPQDLSGNEIFYIPVKLCLGVGVMKNEGGHFRPDAPAYTDELDYALRRIRRLSEVENTE